MMTTWFIFYQTEEKREHFINITDFHVESIDILNNF